MENKLNRPVSDLVVKVELDACRAEFYPYSKWKFHYTYYSFYFLT